MKSFVSPATKHTIIHSQTITNTRMNETHSQKRSFSISLITNKVVSLQFHIFQTKFTDGHGKCYVNHVFEPHIEKERAKIISSFFFLNRKTKKGLTQNYIKSIIVQILGGAEEKMRRRYPEFITIVSNPASKSSQSISTNMKINKVNKQLWCTWIDLQ